MKVLVLMPLLWLVAIFMSYPQIHYKELITMTVNQFVASETNLIFTDWIGKTLQKYNNMKKKRKTFRFLALLCWMRK